VLAIVGDFIMEVRSGRSACTADFGNDLPTLDYLTLPNVDLFSVGVFGNEAIGMANQEVVSVGGIVA
jgi:hypothetical protein